MNISVTALNLLDCTLALLALINPMSKIFLLSTFTKTRNEELRAIAFKASYIAFAVLVAFTLGGNFLLDRVFHVSIYSFKIAGGLVLAFRGFDALNKGLFFDMKHRQRLADMSIVPLASPLIAGPATMTAAVSFPAKYGMPVTLVSIAVAILINMFIMMAAPRINAALMRHNYMGALIRITGLIVATIGIQMALDGVREFVVSIQGMPG